MKKHCSQILPFFLLFFLIVATRPAYGFIIQGTKEKVQSPSYRIENTTYVPLILVCQAFGVDWDWDSVSRKITLINGNRFLRLIVGSNTYLKDGKVSYLKNPVKVKRGTVLVPRRFIYLDWWLWPPPPERVVHRIELIVIDAGHGGKDPGAVGRSGLKEKDVVLDVARYLKILLDRNGLNSILTREDDRFLSLGERTRFSNWHKADVFVSIHANAHRDRRAKGFEVWYLSEAKDSYSRAVAAAENAVIEMENSSKTSRISQSPTVGYLLLDENRIESIELAEEICRQLASQTHSRNRGVKGAGFYVLGVDTPAVLVELGFISNPAEESKLKSVSYRRRLARALCDGIMAYKRRYDQTNGFTD
jgi:N-acetylmuramoyl-L-alanine amidase